MHDITPPGSREIELSVCNHYISTDIVFHFLSKAARRALEALMELNEYQYQSDFAKKYVRQGREEGLKQGLDKGLKQGLDKGLKQGLDKGRKESRKDLQALLRNLLRQRFGKLTRQAQTLIREADYETLLTWADRVLVAPSLQAVFTED